jgi:hypothetical protein
MVITDSGISTDVLTELKEHGLEVMVV